MRWSQQAATRTSFAKPSGNPKTCWSSSSKSRASRRQTSAAGVVGQAFCSAYAASKFGVEGWRESRRFEVEPFGILNTIVEPGFFRTELLTKESTAYAEQSISDYAERTAE